MMRQADVAARDIVYRFKTDSVKWYRGELTNAQFKARRADLWRLVEKLPAQQRRTVTSAIMSTGGALNSFGTVGKVHRTKHFDRKRQFSPKSCAPGSFKTKRSGKALVIVCCPKGKWNRRSKRCRVGTRAQSILKRR